MRAWWLSAKERGVAPARSCSMAPRRQKKRQIACRWRHGELAGRIFGAGALGGPSPPSALVRPAAAGSAPALDRNGTLRRPFLWLPAAAGAGAIFYLLAATEPVLWIVGPVAAVLRRARLFSRESVGSCPRCSSVSRRWRRASFPAAGAPRALTRRCWSDVSSARSRVLSRKSISAHPGRALPAARERSRRVCRRKRRLIASA